MVLPGHNQTPQQIAYRIPTLDLRIKCHSTALQVYKQNVTGKSNAPFALVGNVNKILS